jgi:acyl carrier protein
MNEPGSAPAQGRDETDVRDTVRSVVIELSPERVESATADARLIEDLAYNSLALLELAFTLEDEFDLAPIDEATARQITTLGAVVEHVVSELAQRGELVASS